MTPQPFHGIRAVLDRLIARKPQRRKIAADIAETSHYRECSVRYATAQMILIMLLAVFVAVSFLTGHDRLSMENLSLLISDIGNVVILPERSSTATLTYVADDHNRFVAYRGGLAVLGGERMTLFTATGRESYAVSLRYQTPRLLTTGKALIAYDLGGSSLSAYNSFTKLFETQTSSPIRGVAAGASGSFCVITDDDTLAGCVTLYDGDFDVVSRLHLREYTVCAAIADDGSQLCCASVSSVGGRMMLTLLMAAPGSTAPQASVVLEDAYPVSLTYTDEGLLLLCADAVYALDRQGKVTGEYRFDAQLVRSTKLSADGAVLMLQASNLNAETRVVALNTHADVVYDVLPQQDVTDALLDERECLWVLCTDALLGYRQSETSPASTLSLREQYHTLIPLHEDELYLCGRARSVCVTVAWDAHP